MANTSKISVRVRMYRQGLGDCFLLTFQRKNKPDFNLLIDCGLYQTTKDKTKIMTDVAKNIKQDITNDTLDVVVLTHDHYDHTSGFSLAKDVFDTIEMKQVWVGWTEDKNHPKYDTVRNQFAVQAEGLRAALKLEQMQTEKLTPLRENINALVNDFFGVSENALGAVKDDSRSWEYILKEKNAEVHSCSPGKLMNFEGLEDEVRVYVLGPPEDVDLIMMEEPPADKAEAESYRHLLGVAIAESFLAAVGGGETNGKLNSKSFAPFDQAHSIKPNEAETGAHDEFFKKHYYGLDEKSAKDECVWRRIDSDWLMIAGELALRLDNGTNNTCLALAIELVKSGKVLVFPGDAQFGNWYSWKDLSWKIKDKNGDEIEITTKDLLERTVLYKVGHHGSHNATLKAHGLRMMNSPELVAMIPTNRKFAKEKQGWEMPEKALEEDLIKRARGRVIPADEFGTDDRKKPLRERCENMTENKLPKTKIESFLKQVNFDGSFTTNADEPLYVEYTIKG